MEDARQNMINFITTNVIVVNSAERKALNEKTADLVRDLVLAVARDKFAAPSLKSEFEQNSIDINEVQVKKAIGLIGTEVVALILNSIIIE